MRWARRAVALALFLAAVYVCVRFPAQNAEAVSIDYLAGRLEAVPLWAALLGAFGFGALLAGLAGLYQVTRLSMINRRYRKTARGLEVEIHELRNLPLEGGEPRGDVGTPAESALERSV